MVPATVSGETAAPVQSTDTHCPYCALQCAMTITSGVGTPIIAPREFPTNRGGLCRKGWTAAELLSTPDRVSSPLIRDESGLAVVG
jgi:assimilatory nitrate reductase catalytic subunit